VPANLTWALVIGIGLHLVFALLEAIRGLWRKSLARLPDAGHHLKRWDQFGAGH
jgi:cobalt-zinc-cadmium efflux system protein